MNHNHIDMSETARLASPRLCITAISALLFVVIACTTFAAADPLQTVPCPRCPYCNHERGNPSWWWTCFYSKSPDFADSAMLTRARSCLDHAVIKGVIGQDHITPHIVNHVMHKLEKPNQPLVMHFAGDHGVGKTTVAHAISRALSWRDSATVEGAGDALLRISGTGFDGMPIEEQRRTLVDLVVRHVQSYPRAVILIDDARKLPPTSMRVLQPVLRGEEFPEHPKVSLRTAIVILTSDFGKQGATRGKTIEAMTAQIRSDVEQRWDEVNLSFLQTFVFLPVDLKTTAQKIAYHVFSTLPCREKRVASVEMSDVVPLAIVQMLGPSQDIVKRNGRAIQEQIKLLVDGPLASYFTEKGGTLSSVAVKLKMNEHGDLRVSVKHLDDVGAEEEL